MDTGSTQAPRESIGRVSARDGSAETTELVVIGGGITGCAVARDAAARGIATVLVERRDLAAGTSGRSTKLLHGGLRYLEKGQLGLVRQALREREITARLAPGLAQPMPFIVPIWPGASPGRLKARIGVALYQLLAGPGSLPPARGVGAEEIARLVPGLRTGYLGGVGFADRQTDDVRLTVAMAMDALRRGASIRLGMAVDEVRTDGRRHQLICRHEDGARFVLHAGAVINAAGAWADIVRRSSGRSGPLLRASRGAHLVLRGLPLGAAVLLSGERPGHRIFAIPWRDATLFGTTDVEDEGPPGRDDPEVEDLSLLFREARRLFPEASLTRRNVVSAFTGVRPLVRQTGDTLHASREHAVHDEDGLITIVGGKLTTWRVMAIDAVDRAAERLGHRAPSPAALLDEPLPRGAGPLTLDAVLEEELPRHAEDVVFRRLTLGHDPAEIRRVLPTVVARMAACFAWGRERSEDEAGRVETIIAAMTQRIDDAIGRA